MAGPSIRQSASSPGSFRQTTNHYLIGFWNMVQIPTLVALKEIQAKLLG
jgi:hypothetical protein